MPIKASRMYTYWTNFSRENSSFGEYEVLEDNPEASGYWTFETNIDREYMDTRMTTKDIRSFLFQMLDIYGRKRA